MEPDKAVLRWRRTEMKDTISLKEHRQVVNAYESSTDALRMQLSMDTKKMMQLWDSHQRLIDFLESMTHAGLVSVSHGIQVLARKEIEQAKKVKI